MPKADANGQWTVERLMAYSFVVTPNGLRAFATTHARAAGIAAALNTPEGAKAFEEARHGA